MEKILHAQLELARGLAHGRLIKLLTSRDHWLSIELNKLRLRWPGSQSPEEAPFGICARRDGSLVPWQLLLNPLETVWIHHASRNFHTLWGCAHL